MLFRSRHTSRHFLCICLFANTSIMFSEHLPLPCLPPSLSLALSLFFSLVFWNRWGEKKTTTTKTDHNSIGANNTLTISHYWYVKMTTTKTNAFHSEWPLTNSFSISHSLFLSDIFVFAQQLALLHCLAIVIVWFQRFISYNYNMKSFENKFPLVYICHREICLCFILFSNAASKTK